MSEPITSPYTTEPAEKSGNGRPSRWRFQFSLSSLLLFFLFFALLLSSIVMYWRLSQSEQELVKLRDMAGYLKIEDENLFYAIAIETGEPLTWKWRVYFPAGYKYSWNIQSGKIPVVDLPHGSGASISDASPLTKGTEAIIYLTIRKNFENKWLLNLSCQANNEKNGLTNSIPDEIMNQLLSANMTEDQNIGGGKAVSCKLDQPIIFLKRRIGETQPNGSWRSSQNPMPGIMIWLEAQP